MFKYMDKSDAEYILPILYDIMFENMSKIIPVVMNKDEFVSAVAMGLEYEDRQILLFYNAEEIIGFLQYFISKDNTTFRIEELQIKPEYQMSGVFVGLIRFIKEFLPLNLKYLEAFAHIENVKSLQLQKSLGLSEIGCENGIIHMKGEYSKIKNRYLR